MKHSSSTLARRSVLLASVATLGFTLGSLFGDVNPATMPAAAAPTTAPAPAAAPTSASPSPEVDRLIARLGDDDSDSRDAAQKQLVELGKVAIPALKKAAESSDDPEIRSRAAAALAAMKDHVDNDATLITLHMKDTSASDVLAALSKQSSAQIVSNGIGKMMGVDNRTITVDADGKPFWDVMSDICGQLNVCPRLDVAGRGQMQLLAPINGRNWMQSPHQLCGPFWVSVASVYRARTIDLEGAAGNTATDDQFSVKLVIYPEPKLAVAQISGLVLKEATDNAGHSLLPKPLPAGAVLGNALMMRGVNMGVPGIGLMNRTVESRLSYPENPGTRIALLRGEVDVQLGSDIQQYVVDDVTGTQKITNPLKNCSVQVSVTKQAPGAGVCIANISVTRDGLSDDQWAAVINRSNDVSLEDADGHQLIAITRYNPGMTTDTSFKTSIYFSPTGAMGGMVVRAGAAGAGAAALPKFAEPKRLVWSVATSLKTIKVPVEVKDLPMP